MPVNVEEMEDQEVQSPLKQQDKAALFNLGCLMIVQNLAVSCSFFGLKL